MFYLIVNLHSKELKLHTKRIYTMQAATQHSLQYFFLNKRKYNNFRMSHAFRAMSEPSPHLPHLHEGVEDPFNIMSAVLSP